jgi:hypothetical protein
MSVTGANTKRCRLCRIHKPIKDFPFPKHRLCTDCQSRRKWGVVAEYLPPGSTTGVKEPVPIPGELTPYQQVQAFVNAQQNLPLHTSLHTTRAGVNKYAREIKRHASAMRAAREAAVRSQLGVPEPKADPYKLKTCRHCKLMLPVSRFANPRVRICERCDGPPLV